MKLFVSEFGKHGVNVVTPGHSNVNCNTQIIVKGSISIALERAVISVPRENVRLVALNKKA